MVDIRIDIAPDADPDDTPLSWEWLDISTYRRQAADVELNVGRDDESTTIEASDSTVVFDLRDGYLSGRNVNSELYGRIGVNTPIRYRIPLVTDTFSRTEVGSWGTTDTDQTWVDGPSYNAVNGGSGKMALAAPNTADSAFLPEIAALDMEVLYSVSLSAVTTGAPWISAIFLRYIDADYHYRVHTALNPAGVITQEVIGVRDGAGTILATDSTITGTYVADGKVWTRAHAWGGQIRSKAWVGTLADEPAAWNISTSAVSTEGGGFGFYQWRYVGNTNVGTLTASIDDLQIDAILWTGFVPEWSPRWDKSGNDSTLTIAPGGPFRRLNQGEDPIESPLRRQLSGYAPAGYWPLEDASGATVAGSGVAGGRVARVSDVTFGDDDCPPGALSSMKFNSATSLLTGTTTGDTTAEFAGMIFFKLNALPVAKATLIEWQCTGGTLRRWVISVTGTGITLDVYDSDGNVDYAGASLYGVNPLNWNAIQLETDQVGANVDVDLIWNEISTDTFYVMSTTINTNTSASLTSFRMTGSASLVDARFCHVYAGAETLPFVDTGFLEVANGYAGETAAARIYRLMTEQGLTLVYPSSDSETMDKQTSQKFDELVREGEAADGGLLLERGYAYVYYPREFRYNPSVAMTLSWSGDNGDAEGGDLAESPAPTDDDQRLFTRWKVSRKFGAEAVYVNEDVRARRGLVTNSKEINIYDDDRLAWHAAWATALTTVDEMRWPVVELDLIAHPELIPYFLTCRVGSRIVIENPKDQVPVAVIDLLIEGIKQKIGRNTWEVTLACSPAKIWTELGQYSTAGKLWTSGTTTLAEDIDISETAWNISTTSRWETWSTTASGYQWDLGNGEVVTVTAMTAASGSGPYLQTATVVRGQGVGGVIKTHTTGTAIRMATPTRWAL